MDRSIRRIGLVNLLVLLVVAVGGAALARYCAAWTALPTAVFLGLGFLVSAVSYFQMRLEDRERLEKLEYDELRRTAGGSSLFSQETDTFLARRSREQFEKWFVPGFGVVLFLLQAGGVYWLWVKLAKAKPALIQQPMIAMAVYGLFGLVLFLMGKYATGVARLDRQPLLRPGATNLLLGAYLCFLTTAALGAFELGFPRADYYAAVVLLVVLALVAVENLITLVLEIYRPRMKGQAARVLYESRLIALLGQPEGLITTAAQALDYQFGFKVSETWFYKFLERAFAWLILLQFGVFLASTTFVVIEPNEQGLLERFGRPVAGRAVLEPGLHFKWPWPVDRVERFRTREIQQVVVGGHKEEEEGEEAQPQQNHERVVVWSRSHVKDEFNLLVASRGSATPSTREAGADKAVPVNLLTVAVPIQYQITNLVQWAYNHANASNLLLNLATREVVRYLVNVDVDDIMGAGRLKASDALRQSIQAQAQKWDLGVQLTFLGLQHLHPPVKVVKDYEAVIGAAQEQQTNILTAKAYAIGKTNLATAEATNLLAVADGDNVRRVSSAAAESASFGNHLSAHRSAPQVYRQRAYLETFVNATTNANKVVTAAATTHQVVQLNLEEKIRKDLLDVMLPSSEKK